MTAIHTRGVETRESSGLGHRGSVTPNSLVTGLLHVGSGVARRRDLLAAGVSGRQVDRLFERGALMEVLPGVYAHGAAHPDFSLRLRAALAYAGEGAVAAERTALGLWGVLPLPGISEAMHIAVPHGRRRPDVKGAVLLRQRTRRDFELCGQFPVASLPEALVEYASAVSVEELRFPALEAVRVGAVTPLELAQTEGIPRSALRSMRLVAEEAAAGAISGGEATYWRLIVAAGLPKPRLNAPVATPAGAFVVDALWDDLGLGAEIDGRSIHAQEAAFAADRRRQNAIHAVGIMLIRFAVADILLDGPAIVQQTESAMVARAAERSQVLRRDARRRAAGRSRSR